MAITRSATNAEQVLHISAAQDLLGAYYTPTSAADYMANWVVRYAGEHVLEPSFGEGTFIRAIIESAARRNFNSIRLTGVEIDERAQAHVLQYQQTSDLDVRCEDFLGVSPFKVQAVIGNPPYVRLRHLPESQRERALDAARLAMGRAMDPSGSLWMPFLLHAMRFLENGGRLAFVLPYDFTYVRYARPLWDALRQNFGSLQVLRTHERLFPELLQDVVILLADSYGTQTTTVRYRAFEQINDLLSARPVVDQVLDINALLRGERVFVKALLGDELRRLLSTRVADATIPARRLVTFNIGYVAGDKAFFHPTSKDILDYQIPSHSLYPSLTSTRMLTGAGLWSSSLDGNHKGRLFLPDPSALTTGDQAYIDLGEQRGVSTRYKCRVRDPWFVVPGTRSPEVVLGVFSECPILLINDAGFFASNSLLCGYLRDATSEEIASGWYTSLTVLQCEIEVHALGGGVMVMVPREAGNIRLPKQVYVRAGHMDCLDRLLRLGKTAEAYESGDGEVLIEQLQFSKDDIDLVRQGAKILAHWRTSARPSLD